MIKGFNKEKVKLSNKIDYFNVKKEKSDSYFFFIILFIIKVMILN